MTDIECARCGDHRAGLPAPPFRDELGQRIHEKICRDCWDLWLKRQMQLINHYALDVRTPEAREFLKRNVRAFLFGEGEGDTIDVDQQGRIEAPDE